MDHIVDGTFRDIPDRTDCTDANTPISSYWWVKTLNGAIKAYATKVPTGIQYDAYYPNDGFLYTRQEIPNVMQFSSKKYILRVVIDRVSWQSLEMDVYIQAKLNSDGSNRVLVIDTEAMTLLQGCNEFNIPITVPDLSNEIAETGNTLQTAVRLIGKAGQNTQAVVNSIELLDAQSGASITIEQYDAICNKISELIE